MTIAEVVVMRLVQHLLPVPFLLVGLGASAATFTVDNVLDGPDLLPGDGLCIAPAVMGGPPGRCTLRAAVMEANALAGADTVLLPSGAFALTLSGAKENAAASGDLDVTEDLTIAGAGHTATLISGEESTRIIEVLPFATLDLVDLALVNGRAISAATFTGGAAVVAGELLATDCRFENNLANNGGAILILSTGSATFVDSLFDDNGVDNLGFTNPQGSTVRVQGELTMSRSAVIGGKERARGPAAISGNCTGDIVITDSTVAGNNGGITTFNCDVTLTHVTIAGNRFDGLVMGSFDGSHVRLVQNSIIAGNDADCANVSGTVFSFSLDEDGSCGLASAPGSLSATDPLLLPLAQQGGPTPTLLPDAPLSPVIDAADPGACTATDQRGVSRGADGNGDGLVGCDMGAAEFVPELVFADGFEESA